MEETKNSQPKHSSQGLVHDCAIDLYENCKLNEKLDLKSVAESLNSAKSLLNSTQETFEHLETSLNEEFKIYSEILANIDEKFIQLNDDHYQHELCLIMEEIHQFQKRFSESSLFTESTKLKSNIKLAAEINFHRGSDGNKLTNKSERTQQNRKTEFCESKSIEQEDNLYQQNSSNQNQQIKNQEEQKIKII